MRPEERPPEPVGGSGDALTASPGSGLPARDTWPESFERPWKAIATGSSVASSGTSTVCAVVRADGKAVDALKRTTPAGTFCSVNLPSSPVTAVPRNPSAVAVTLTPPSLPAGSPETVPSICAPLATWICTPSIGWLSARTTCWGVDATVFDCAESW